MYRGVKSYLPSSNFMHLELRLIYVHLNWNTLNTDGIYAIYMLLVLA